jgi:ATP-binding cassette subfamily B protein
VTDPKNPTVDPRTDTPVPDRSGYERPRAAVHPDPTRSWLRRLWPVIAIRRRSLLAGLAAGLLATAASVAVPVTLGSGVDAAAAGDSIAPAALALLGFAAARFAFGFFYRYRMFSSAHHVENDLRNLVYERLTELSFSYWDRVQSGQVISRANSDIRSIQLLLAFGPLVAMQLVLLVLGLAVMIALSLPLTLVAVAPLPLVLLVGLQLRERVFPLSWVTQARMADLATIVDENIQGARVVKAFAQEEHQIRLLARSARRLRWAGTSTADARARWAPLMEGLPRLGMALVLLYGGTLAIDGRVEIGDLVMFNAFVLLMTTPFRLIGLILIQWQRAAAASVRVFEILDERPTIVEPADPIRLMRPAGRVEMIDVGFAYPAGDGTTVLSGFDLTVEPGETVAIVGRTGSGKSTIARLLPRFYDVDQGAVRIDGIDVRRLSLGDLRRAVTVVTDDPFLFARSIHENVAFARPDVPVATVEAALADASASRFVADLPARLDTELGERGSTISGGQRQRLAIARALVADPAVLVLDDATSAIDVAVEEQVHEALSRRRADRTTILIAHRLSTIALADRVVFMDEGRVVASGGHHELLASEPRYAAVLTDETAGEAVTP